MSQAQTAGKRVRSGYRRALVIGFAVSAAVHVIVALVDPPLRILTWRDVTRLTEVVRLAPRETAFLPPAPDVELPREQPTIPRPSRPVPLTEPVAGPPEVIPYDIPPRLENGETITALIRSRFPRGLELTETEPSVLLWLFVDRAGRVTRMQLARSSGHMTLDNLAEQAAREMAFRPAIHAGKSVAVWVAQRIRFTREDGAEAEGPSSGTRAGEGREERADRYTGQTRPP